MGIMEKKMETTTVDRARLFQSIPASMLQLSGDVFYNPHITLT